jgi:hypothetical protein
MTQNNWLCRFVLPDGTVVLPEEIGEIHLFNCWFVYRRGSVLPIAIEDARKDRPTGHQINSVPLYENDRFSGNDGRVWEVFWSERWLQWQVLTNNEVQPLEWLVGIGYIKEIVGMVPYTCPECGGK